METEVNKNYGGKIIARIETDARGNKTVKDYFGKTLGRYDAQSDTTREYYGHVVARGDAVGMLIHDR